MHRKTKNGYEPLKACMRKTKVKKDKIKHIKALAKSKPEEVDNGCDDGDMHEEAEESAIDDDRGRVMKKPSAWNFPPPKMGKARSALKPFKKFASLKAMKVRRAML